MFDFDQLAGNNIKVLSMPVHESPIRYRSKSTGMKHEATRTSNLEYDNMISVSPHIADVHHGVL